MYKKLKVILELIPIIIFFATYKLLNLEYATGAMIVTSVFSLTATYFLEKKLSITSIVSMGILTFFGGMTLYSGDTTFIKVKPTIINLLFSLVLLIGVLNKKGLIKYILGHAIKLTDENWIVLSKRWGYFFAFLSFLNELIWRNFSEDFWVNFKVFGLTTFSAVFLIFQLSFIAKNNISDGDKA